MNGHSATTASTAAFAHPARNVAALGIEPGMRVADFGAGSGAYVRAIAAILNGNGTVYAVDVQKDLLRRIKNDCERDGLSGVEVLWGDLEEEHGSKLANAAVELVLISNILFQVHDKQMLLKEAARVTREHGRVVIIDWSESFGHMGPTPEHVVEKEKAYEYARNAGLTYVKDFPAGAHHYGLIFRKTKRIGEHA